MIGAVALALALLAIALTPATPARAQDPRTSLPDIEDEVMCAECGTPLNLSDSQVAEDEREFIREQIALGKSKEEIKAALVERYGPSILAVPEDDGFNLTLYVLPAVLAAAGIAGVALVAARWRRGRGPEGAAAAGDGPPPDPGDERRLDAELAEFDR